MTNSITHVKLNKYDQYARLVEKRTCETFNAHPSSKYNLKNPSTQDDLKKSFACIREKKRNWTLSPFLLSTIYYFKETTPSAANFFSNGVQVLGFKSDLKSGTRAKKMGL